jgi:hypothetical protein
MKKEFKIYLAEDFEKTDTLRRIITEIEKRAGKIKQLEYSGLEITTLIECVDTGFMRRTLERLHNVNKVV